jgi:hypothetical protein
MAAAPMLTLSAFAAGLLGFVRSCCRCLSVRLPSSCSCCTAAFQAWTALMAVCLRQEEEGGRTRLRCCYCCCCYCCCRQIRALVRHKTDAFVCSEFVHVLRAVAKSFRAKCDADKSHPFVFNHSRQVAIRSVVSHANGSNVVHKNRTSKRCETRRRPEVTNSTASAA